MDASVQREVYSVSRFAETETALVERLRSLKAAPEMSFTLGDLTAPLGADGYTKDEISAVLHALEQERIVAFGPGNRLLVLKALP